MGGAQKGRESRSTVQFWLPRGRGGASRHDGPGVGVRSGLLRIGGSFNTGTGIAQAPGIPLGGCSRGWGRSLKALVLPVEELVGLSGGRPKAPEQPAVDKAGSCRWRRRLGSRGGVLGIQTAVAWGNGVSVLTIKENE